MPTHAGVLQKWCVMGGEPLLYALLFSVGLGKASSREISGTKVVGIAAGHARSYARHDCHQQEDGVQ